MRSNHDPMNQLAGTVITWVVIVGGALLALIIAYGLAVMMMAAIP